jgi:soluble lytic murein transglycosylase-like protein
VLAVAEVESSLNGKVIGRQDPHAVHYGLMQLKLGTARMLGFKGHPKDLLQWKTNLKIGIVYLNEKLEKHGSVQAASAAYNAGAPYICKKGRTCTRGSFVNQGYVNHVMKLYKRHENLECISDDSVLAGK